MKAYRLGENTVRRAFILPLLLSVAALYSGGALLSGCGANQIPTTEDKIVFTSGRDGNPEIYIMETTGTRQRRLTNNVARDFQPTLRPDRAEIVFTSDRDGDDELYR